MKPFRARWVWSWSKPTAEVVVIQFLATAEGVMAVACLLENTDTKAESDIVVVDATTLIVPKKPSDW